MKTFFLFIISTIVFFQYGTAQTKNGFSLANSIIPVEEIKHGGPARDGIPAIDHPFFIKGTTANMADDERILGVVENGIAKAYPINILNYHEIVNDHFGDQPVVVTYCPLCGSGVAFKATINSKISTFGVSGLLYNSDVLLYDRQTQSLWSQLMFKAIAGPLAGEDLEVLATENTTWAYWKNAHPGTLVLTEDTGFSRDYSKNPYPDYDISRQLYFPVSDQDERFHPKTRILGVIIDGKQKAYPFSELKKLEDPTLIDTFHGKVLHIT